MTETKNLFARALAAIEDPACLTAKETAELQEDLAAIIAELESADARP